MLLRFVNSRRRFLSVKAFRARPFNEILALPGAPATAGFLAERSASYSTLEVTVSENGVANVLLNRPSKQNALNIPMWEELIDCFAAVSRDPTVRVAVLGGAGKHFCSGMDLGVFQDMKQFGAEEKCEGRIRERVLRSILYFQEAISAPEKCAKPVLAALDGNVIGGAVDLITACDMRYCTKNATFSVKEVDLAIVADVGTMQRLPFLV